MGRTILAVLRDLALLISRLVLGAILVLHGWTRWGGGPGIDAQAEYLRSNGVPEPLLLAWGGTLLELAGGIFLVFGALTPVVGLAVLVEHVVIIAYLAWRHGPFARDGGYELPAAIAALALLHTVFGAGRVAVDALLRRPADETTTVGGGVDTDAFPTTRY